MCLLTLSLALVALASSAADPSYLPWDKEESIEEYAKRVNLPPTKMLDLASGITMEFVLIPAGKFVMGTEEPKPVDEEGFRSKILTGQVFLGIGGGSLLLLLGVILSSAIRKRQRPQYSLACFLAMTVAAGIGMMGGWHWSHSSRALDVAKAEHKAALARYESFVRHSVGWEPPAREVTLMKPYFIGKYEVTQEQYETIMGGNPSWCKGRPDLPVESTSWVDAKTFCEKTGTRLRLPSEVEWEYACRAGTKTTYCSGDTEADLDSVGWHQMNSDGKTHPVGQKRPNAWGAYDMHGNVFEWCEDQTRGKNRVLRGGAWNDNYRVARSYFRIWTDPNVHFRGYGFRVVLAAQQGSEDTK